MKNIFQYFAKRWRNHLLSRAIDREIEANIVKLNAGVITVEEYNKLRTEVLNKINDLLK